MPWESKKPTQLLCLHQQQPLHYTKQHQLQCLKDSHPHIEKQNPIACHTACNIKQTNVDKHKNYHFMYH